MKKLRITGARYYGPDEEELEEISRKVNRTKYKKFKLLKDGEYFDLTSPKGTFFPAGTVFVFRERDGKNLIYVPEKDKKDPNAFYFEVSPEELDYKVYEKEIKFIE